MKAPLLLVASLFLFSSCENVRIGPRMEPIEYLLLSWYHNPASPEGPSFRFKVQTDYLEYKYDLTYGMSVEGSTVFLRLTEQTLADRCPEYPGNGPNTCFSWREIFLPESLLGAYGDYKFVVETPLFTTEGIFSYNQGEAILTMPTDSEVRIWNESSCIQPIATLRGGLRYRGEFNDSMMTAMLLEFEALGLVATDPDSAYIGCNSVEIKTLQSSVSTSVYGTYYAKDFLYHYPASIPFQSIVDIAESYYSYMWKNPWISNSDWNIYFTSGYGDEASFSDREGQKVQISTR